jgi:excisionase family DNA binding protein
MATSPKKQKQEIGPQFRLLSIYDVAAILQVRHETVRDWIDAGKIPHIRLSIGTLRVRREALEQFILSLETVGKVPDSPKRPGKQKAGKAVIAA